jgi:hypothetical protein
LAALAGLSFLSVGAPAAAQDVPEADTYETTRGIGLGSGNRASARATSALAYNPAAIGLAPAYHLEAFAGYQPDQSGWSVGGAAVDSVTNKVAAGVSFRGVFDLGEANYQGYDGRLGLAVPFSDKIALGVSGRFLKLRPQAQDVDPADTGVKGFTLDASVTLVPVEGLSIAGFGYNLIDRDSPLAPMRVGGGASYSFGETFSVGGEGLVDLSTFDHATVIAGGGVEYFAGGLVPLRFGYRYDSGRDIHSVSGGLGYVDQQVGIDVSLRQDVDGASDTKLLFSLRYHVQ